MGGTAIVAHANPRWTMDQQRYIFPNVVWSTTDCRPIKIHKANNYSMKLHRGPSTRCFHLYPRRDNMMD